MHREFLAWYLAPWRRMHRLEFAAWLTAASLPGLVFWAFGLMESPQNWLSPLLSLGQALNSSPEAALQNITQLQELASAPPPAPSIDWSTLTSSTLQLLMVPLCWMRLRDMGKPNLTATALGTLFNISALNDASQALTLGEIPLSSLFSTIGFVGFIWLCLGQSAPKVAPHERIPS